MGKRQIMGHYLTSNRKFVGFIIGIIPAMLITLYIVAYMLDLMNVVYVLSKNDTMVKDGMVTQNLKEVVDFKEDASGLYKLKLDGSSSSEVEVGFGDVLFTVGVINETWFSLATNTNLLYAGGSELFTAEKSDKGYLIKCDDLEFNVESGDTVCTVSISDDGSYLVEYEDKDSTVVKRDSLMNVATLVKNGNKYKMRVTTDYSLDLKGMECSYCTTLPTDNLYYDIARGTCVRNTTQSFATSFVMGSKLVIVLMSAGAWFILLWYMKVKGLAEGISGTMQLIINAVSLLALALCVMLTYLCL